MCLVASRELYSKRGPPRDQVMPFPTGRAPVDTQSHEPSIFAHLESLDAWPPAPRCGARGRAPSQVRGSHTPHGRDRVPAIRRSRSQAPGTSYQANPIQSLRDKICLTNLTQTRAVSNPQTRMRFDKHEQKPGVSSPDKGYRGT